jgi:hypothetical protein
MTSFQVFEKKRDMFRNDLVFSWVGRRARLDRDDIQGEHASWRAHLRFFLTNCRGGRLN